MKCIVKRCVINDLFHERKTVCESLVPEDYFKAYFNLCYILRSIHTATVSEIKESILIFLKQIMLQKEWWIIAISTCIVWIALFGLQCLDCMPHGEVMQNRTMESHVFYLYHASASLVFKAKRRPFFKDKHVPGNIT